VAATAGPRRRRAAAQNGRTIIQSWVGESSKRRQAEQAWRLVCCAAAAAAAAAGTARWCRCLARCAGGLYSGPCAAAPRRHCPTGRSRRRPICSHSLPVQWGVCMQSYTNGWERQTPPPAAQRYTEQRRGQQQRRIRHANEALTHRSCGPSRSLAPFSRARPLAAPGGVCSNTGYHRCCGCFVVAAGVCVGVAAATHLHSGRPAGRQRSKRRVQRTSSIGLLACPRQ